MNLRASRTLLMSSIRVCTHSWSDLDSPHDGAKRSDPLRKQLVGITWTGAKLETQLPIPISDSQHNTTLQFGGGLDLAVRPNFGVRVAADYRRVSRVETD